MAWYNESHRHSLASKGISTVPQKMGSRGKTNESLIKHKLSNNIERNITALDRKLRKVSSLKSPEDIQRNLEEAEKLYSRLGSKMKTHKDKFGGFPDWITHDWVNKEQFSNNGRVKKVMDEMKNAKPEKIPKLQVKLFNLIRIGDERKRM